MYSFCFDNDLDYNKGTLKSSFLNKIIELGYKPIGITLLLNEDVIIFKTQNEVNDIKEEFKYYGLFYDIESWKMTHAIYINDIYGGVDTSAPVIYWIE